MPKVATGANDLSAAAAADATRAIEEVVFKASGLDGTDIVAGVDLLDLSDPAALKFWFYALLGLAALSVALWQLRKATAIARIPPPVVSKKSE